MLSVRVAVCLVLLSAGVARGGLLGKRAHAADGAPDQHKVVRGITISCQTWGWEWGTDGFEEELSDLQSLGVNWVAIHPYARIHADGRVSWRDLDPAQPPAWITRPIQAARRRGMGIMIKPHLAYWGSPFRWRGEIKFPDAERRARFFEQYSAWILALAQVCRDADAFAVGTELDRLIEHEGDWRALIACVRTLTPARLTYAANWTDFERVPFWDALDAVGIQAYFPLSERPDPTRGDLLAGWEQVVGGLRRLHADTGKPIVFTELGYNLSMDAAREPWGHAKAPDERRAAARELQALCYRVGLEVLERERSWLRGAFLWKWFVGQPGHNDANFLVDTPTVRSVLSSAWREKRGPL